MCAHWAGATTWALAELREVYAHYTFHDLAQHPALVLFPYQVPAACQPGARQGVEGQDGECRGGEGKGREGKGRGQCG